VPVPGRGRDEGSWVRACRLRPAAGASKSGFLGVMVRRAAGASKSGFLGVMVRACARGEDFPVQWKGALSERAHPLFGLLVPRFLWTSVHVIEIWGESHQ
jgi:hypothetical protein